MTVANAPSVVTYVDLTVYDIDPSTLVAMAVTAAQQLLPDWQALEGSTEMVVYEGMAVQIGQLIYAINRLPGAIFATVAQLYGVGMDPGTPPTVEVVFTAADTAGYTIPAGSTFQLTLPLATVTFTNLVDVDIPNGSTTVTASLTATTALSDANNTPSGTALAPLNSLWFLNSAVTSTVVTGGVDPETNDHWLARVASSLQSINSAACVPAQFTAIAQNDTADDVFRAYTVDNWNPGGTSPGRTFTDGAVTSGSTALTSPTLAQFAFTDVGRTVAGTGIPAGTVIQSVTDPSDAVLSQAATATGTGLTITLGDLVTAGQTAAGYVTVAVIGQGGTLLTTQQKSNVQQLLESKACAGLNINVIDPTVNEITLDVTVWQSAGYTPSQVQANIVAALTSDPATGGYGLATDYWPWGQPVRLFDLAAAIKAVAGVAYVSSISQPYGDLTLNGIAPLAALGADPTITVLGP